MNLGNIVTKLMLNQDMVEISLKKGKALRFSKENLDFVSKKKDELNKKNIELKKNLKKQPA